MSRFLNWLWSFLPDKCEYREHGMKNGLCPRKGVRGNENWVTHPLTGERVLVCDDCHVWLSDLYSYLDPKEK